MNGSLAPKWYVRISPKPRRGLVCRLVLVAASCCLSRTIRRERLPHHGQSSVHGSRRPSRFSSAPSHGAFAVLRRAASAPRPPRPTARFSIFPLEGIDGWNGPYGPRGFHQCESVMPLASAVEGCREVLLEVHASGRVSRLIVRKDFDPRDISSFPCEGLTLAMDSARNMQRCRQFLGASIRSSAHTVTLSIRPRTPAWA